MAFLATAFCADYQIEANIRYGQYAENVLDIIQSPAPALKNRPGVIVIHGDGAKERTIEQFCVPLVQHDFVVANVEYRSPISSDAKAAVNDVLEAAQWFHKHAARFKVDPDQILVLGESTGGYLALMLGMTPASADLGPVTKISAVINFYGVTDVAGLSPIAYVRRGLPPILTIHGDDQSVHLTKALKEAGADAELIVVPGGQLEPGEMTKLWSQIFKWLRKRKIGG
ncbi:MAG TPA: alpha/beta hydrolase [Bryobacteraceae bacterium]|nr:alpha/beta hydrolase [Bryobacteraceae bacterium]